MLARVAEEVQSSGITERHQIARRARAVWVTDDRDGMSTLHALLPSVLAHGVKDRLDQMAHGLRGGRRTAVFVGGNALGSGDSGDLGTCGTSGDVGTCGASGDARGSGESRDLGTCGTSGDVGTCGASGDAGESSRSGDSDNPDARTVDQIRADLLADILLTSAPTSVSTAMGAIRATVAITIPVLTLVGRSDDGAELDGSAPIDADTARRLAGGEVGWDRVLTHPVTGAVLATDRYRPTAEMKRFLTHRDQHCRHPGCRVPVRYTDIDHNQDWAHGGKTDVANLSPLCRRHHTLKTSAGWTIVPRPGGVLEFVTPLGYRYIDAPHPRSVAFMPGDVAGLRHTRTTGTDDAPPW